MAKRKRKAKYHSIPVQVVLVPDQCRLLEGLDERAKMELRAVMAELLLEAALSQEAVGADDE